MKILCHVTWLWYLTSDGMIWWLIDVNLTFLAYLTSDSIIMASFFTVSKWKLVLSFIKIMSWPREQMRAKYRQIKYNDGVIYCKPSRDRILNQDVVPKTNIHICIYADSRISHFLPYFISSEIDWYHKVLVTWYDGT